MSAFLRLDLMRYSGVPTKRGAIIRAIHELNRQQRLGKAAEILGTFKDFISQDELHRMRKDG